ncbi:hypothetical protein NC651_037809 [Populus alba x Populus x berolinensis]|nr:hypothetical protein NC651_037809 [Populus alba x Populus x berolinensis]
MKNQLQNQSMHQALRIYQIAQRMDDKWAQGVAKKTQLLRIPSSIRLELIHCLVKGLLIKQTKMALDYHRHLNHSLVLTLSTLQIQISLNPCRLILAFSKTKVSQIPVLKCHCH